MPYLGSYQGDYLGAYRGDPGLFGFLGKTVKKVAGSLLGSTPIGVGMRTISGLAGGPVRQNQGRQVVMPAPGLRGAMQRLVPGGASGLVDKEGKPVRIRKDGKPYKKPTMNVANARALRRSIRRQQGFIKLARRALRGTGYSIGRSGTRRRSTVINERGPGSVVVR